MAESKGVWFLVGLSLGALAGVLYAPQSGERTREMLRDKAGEGRDRIQRKAAELRQQAGQQVTSIREQVDNVREQATDIADRGKSAVTRQIDQFQAAVEAGKQAYREAAGLERAANKGDATARL